MINFDQTRLVKVCQENDISFLGVFGSVARGDYRSESDVDLVARFDKQKSLFDLILIEDRLKEVFHRDVDLLTEKSISPYLKDQIEADLQQLYVH
ncbi:MAG: nucleotidyltransferase family protein [Candidatus Shapirobacteria bacterium]